MREREAFFKEACQKKDEECQRLRTEIEVKDRAIATLTTELKQLEEHLGEAAKTEIFLNEELNRFKYGIQPGEDGVSQTNPTSPQNAQSLKTLIKSWKQQSKSTRDWTKANQLISELENFL